MTTSQDLNIELSKKDDKISEIRQKLNELSGKETLEDGEAAEIETLRAELSEKETQRRATNALYRSALDTEGEEESRALGLFEGADGESSETRALLRDSPLSGYMATASAGLGLTGRAAELNAALQVAVVGPAGGVLVPWAVLAGQARANGNSEQRAFTSTAALDGGVSQRPILQRLFGVGIMDALGVRIDSVPAGRSEWPLLTAGVVPANVAEGTAAADAVAATFTTQTLKPKKLTAKYEYTHEQSAQVPMIEAALRRDLADAVKSKMSDLILNGDAGTNVFEPNGFLTKLTAPTAPSTEASFADYAALSATIVDGIHAAGESEVAVVLGVETYKHAARIFQTSGSGESAGEALKRRSMSVMAASYVPVAASDVQSGNLLHAAGPNGGGADMRGDSIAAVWPALEIIRDPYTQASQGVVLTWLTQWDAYTAFRASAYSRVSFKLA